MLQTTLQINGRTIGWIDIARRKDQVNPPPPDAYLTYDYKITITRSGGYDVHDGMLMHRYGDGAWALVALAIDAAGLWPLWNRQTAEMTEIRRRNQATIDRNLEILNENTELRAEIARLRKVVADEVDRFDRECDRGDAARAEIERMKQACADADRAADEQINGLQDEVDQLRQYIEDHPLPISPEEQASIDAYEGNGA